jgi:SAM-dependent methyltransferase
MLGAFDYSRQWYDPSVFVVTAQFVRWTRTLPGHVQHHRRLLSLSRITRLMSRVPIPAGLKRYLVPVWNVAHRIGWLARDYAGACVRGRWETCVVCGKFRPMLFRRRVIPRRLEELWGLSPRLAEALARKESSACSNCGANLRARRIAAVILQNFQVGNPPAPVRSIHEWTRSQEIARLMIAEINRIEGLHQELACLPGLQASDYHPGASPGDVVAGIRSEDLTHLTYPDDSLDLVLTSETLEHVPDLAAALEEIARVLVPGGRHIFTVPLLPGVAQTSARIVTRADGTLDHRAPRICHPGGDVGYPVFTEFGSDLSEILRQAGFEVNVSFGPASSDDLAQVYVCRRPGGQPIKDKLNLEAPAEAPPFQHPPD